MNQILKSIGLRSGEQGATFSLAKIHPYQDFNDTITVFGLTCDLGLHLAGKSTHFPNQYHSDKEELLTSASQNKNQY